MSRVSNPFLILNFSLKTLLRVGLLQIIAATTQWLLQQNGVMQIIFIVFNIFSVYDAAQFRFLQHSFWPIIVLTVLLTVAIIGKVNSKLVRIN